MAATATHRYTAQVIIREMPGRPVAAIVHIGQYRSTRAAIAAIEKATTVNTNDVSAVGHVLDESGKLTTTICL